MCRPIRIVCGYATAWAWQKSVGSLKERFFNPFRLLQKHQKPTWALPLSPRNRRRRDNYSPTLHTDAQHLGFFSCLEWRFRLSAPLHHRLKIFNTCRKKTLSRWSQLPSSSRFTIPCSAVYLYWRRDKFYNVEEWARERKQAETWMSRPMSIMPVLWD